MSIFIFCIIIKITISGNGVFASVNIDKTFQVKLCLVTLAARQSIFISFLF